MVERLGWISYADDAIATWSLWVAYARDEMTLCSPVIWEPCSKESPFVKCSDHVRRVLMLVQ